MSVLIDTNIFVANADSGEEVHPRARALLRQLTQEAPFTTDHVIVETWAIIRRRAGWHLAERFLAQLRASPIVLEPVTPADLERAAAIGTAWPDQEFDLVDRTSFAVMERLGCSRVASFDRDFAVYRYGRDRREAFEVLS